MNDVVVGVDGSPGSQQALRFAAEEARLRNAKLVVVHAWELPVTAGSDPFSLGMSTLEVPVGEVAEALERSAATVLDDAVDELGAGIEIERRLVEGGAANALVDASEGAAVLVVGARGHGGFTGLVLGSVSARCIHHARCPVIVVPHGEK